MKWIGLTGGIASGKTTVANFFREMGVPVVDADRLAHAALSKNKDKIATYFGPDILDDSGEINRKKLGQKVFQEPKNLKILEGFIHPYVKQRVDEKKRLFELAGEKVAIYDVPLLFENQLESEFDEVILVYVPEEKSKERLMERNGLTAEEAQARISSQMGIEEKKQKASVVLNNEGDRNALRALVKDYYDQLSGAGADTAPDNHEDS